MTNQTLCPNCREAIEPGAIYCGNCGFQLYTQPVGDNNSFPSYAIPPSHHKQHWLAMAVAFGILGICGALLIPILGMALGIIGLILVTTSYHLGRGWLKPVSLIVTVIAVLVGIGVWINTLDHNNKGSTPVNQAGIANGVATVNVNTPCYSLTFNSILNVNNASGSCTINAYNGSSLDSSSDIYKVLASNTSVVNTLSFDTDSKAAIEQDVTKNLPAFSITNEQPSLFNGSAAYYIQAYDSAANAAVIEEAVLHISKAKNNFFVIVHAANGQSVNLDSLASGWQWSN